ncbi:MAG TPA: hypothetical protein VKO87_00895 [Gemmatimonadaceae bacterium]|nr:hypothetical protein [Gemmatimonadaceae bacterium]
MFSSLSPQNRRAFINRISGISALALVAPTELAFGEQASSTSAPWDLSWLDSLKGKHKQVFDFGSLELADRDILAGDTPLRVPRNYMNAHKEVYGLEHPEINTIVGITSSAFPMNANDEIWSKYSLGEKWKIKDSSTGTWAVRNLFSNPAAPFNDKLSSLDALRHRGTIFWQCNNALNGVVQNLAAAMKLDPAKVREELVAGLMPGVRLVPAHTMALGLAQERGCTYEKL